MTMTDRDVENRAWRMGFLDAAYMLLRRGREDVLKAAEEFERMEASDLKARYLELLKKEPA